jgi:DNA-binding Lrp family transcriptional regulator
MIKMECDKSCFHRGIRLVGSRGKGAPVDDRYAVDAIDRRILAVLGAEGRCSVNELAARVGIGRATAYARLGRLEAEGVIEGYTVRVDHRRLGLEISALLLVRVEQRSWRDIAPQLRRLPGAEWLSATAGEFDFALLVRAPDVRHLRDVILEQVMAIEGVRSSETVLILEDDWLPESP